MGRLALAFALLISGADVARLDSQGLVPPGGFDDARGQIARAQVKTFELHGPFLLQGRRLAGLSSRTASVFADDEADANVGCGATCGIVTSRLGEPEALVQTPAPIAPPWSAAVSLGALDPQIAAGTTYLVVTAGVLVAFYDKAGQLLVDGNGTTINPLPVKTLFQDLIPQMNSLLNLPTGADPTIYDLSKFYDARTVYDPFRRRFFIAALASNTVATGPAGDDGKPTPTKMDRAARRTKMLAAVSQSEDPRDGWLLYWWNAVIDDGVCNDPDVDSCTGTYNEPGDAGDYPSLGISDKFFVVTNHVGRYDPDQPTVGNSERYGVVHVLPADSLAGLAPPAPNWAYWDIRYPSANSVAWSIIQPAVHHTADPLGFTFLAANKFSDGTNDTLAVFGFSHLEAPVAPPLRVASVQLNDPIVNPPDAPELDGSAIEAVFKIANVQSPPLKAAYRDNRLHVSWQTCREWPDAGACVAANELVRLDTSEFVFANITSVEFIDRVFGWRNPIDDPPSEMASYGLPAVEVNKDGDMAIVYVRSSADMYPQARYSVYFHGAADILPSRLLKAGEAPLPKKNQTDTGGVSVDPFDDTGIWMAESYAYKPNSNVNQAQQRLVVGKVFGRPHPDLIVRSLAVKSTQAGSDTALDGTVTVRNQGDGSADAFRVSVLLRRQSSAIVAPPLIPIFEAKVPSLDSGANDTIAFSVVLPMAGGAYDLIAVVDPDDGVEEYSETNNIEVAKAAVHVGS